MTTIYYDLFYTRLERRDIRLHFTNLIRYAARERCHFMGISVLRLLRFNTRRPHNDEYPETIFGGTGPTISRSLYPWVFRGLPRKQGRSSIVNKTNWGRLPTMRHANGDMKGVYRDRVACISLRAFFLWFALRNLHHVNDVSVSKYINGRCTLQFF